MGGGRSGGKAERKCMAADRGSCSVAWIGGERRRQRPAQAISNPRDPGRDEGMNQAERTGMVADRGPRSGAGIGGVRCSSAPCASECRTPPIRTLEAWMPKKIEVSNKYQIFQVENAKEEVIGAIKAEE